MASKNCKKCDNSGRCPKCKGVGSFATEGAPHSRHGCTACHCTGRCNECDGKAAPAGKRGDSARA